jgi:hypothetical protein
MIFCGFVKLKIYYGAFQINIADYLELTEILTSFVGDIVVYSLMILFGYLFSFLLTTRQRTDQQTDLGDDILNTDGFFTRLVKHLKNLRQVIFMIVTLGLINLIAVLIKGETHTYGIFTFYSLIILLLFVIFREEYRRKYISQFNKDINHSFSNIVLTGILFVSFTIKYSYFDIDATKKSKKYYGTQILTTDNEKIISDILTYYIGMTNSYVFIYNQSRQETRVLNRGDIKEIIVK